MAIAIHERDTIPAHRGGGLFVGGGEEERKEEKPLQSKKKKKAKDKMSGVCEDAMACPVYEIANHPSKLCET